MIETPSSINMGLYDADPKKELEIVDENRIKIKLQSIEQTILIANELAQTF